MSFSVDRVALILVLNVMVMAGLAFVGREVVPPFSPPTGPISTP